MIAVVTGASGFVGGNLAKLLVDDGVKVRATRRSPASTAHLSDVAIEWVEADLDDEAKLVRAFDGAEVVFHCAGVATQTCFRGGSQRAANVDGTKRVLSAVKRANVARLVHCSSVVTCAIATGSADVDEAMPWNYASVDRGLGDDQYALTKREAERAVIASGVDAVVVNPGTMFGPLDAKPSSGRLITNIAQGRIFAATSGVTSAVDVRDVCRGMIAAWRKGKRGERYILAGLNITYSALFDVIAREVGVRWSGRTLPDLVVRAAGAAGDVVERVLRREMQLNSAVVAYAVCKGYRFSSAKAMRELGYTLTPLDKAVRDAVAWFRERGMLPAVR
jgi:dihydroflavonol-4-reductase